MKFLLVLVVVVIGLWLLLRGRGTPKPPVQPTGRPGSDPERPVEMVACARCGLNLPRPDALADAQGRLFCSHEHRDTGPG